MDITAEDLQDERPRRGLFKDPAAVPVWAGITALDEATQHEVLKELRVRLVDFDTRDGDVNRKRARAIARASPRGGPARREVADDHVEINRLSPGGLYGEAG